MTWNTNMSKSRDRRGFGFSPPLPPTVYTPEQIVILQKREKLFGEAKKVYEKECYDAQDRFQIRLSEIENEFPTPRGIDG